MDLGQTPTGIGFSSLEELIARVFNICLENPTHLFLDYDLKKLAK